MESKYTKEILEKYVKESISFSDLIRKMTNSEKVHGSLIAYIKNKLELFSIDFSHFVGRRWSKNLINPNGVALTKKQFLENYMTLNPIKKTNNTNLKKYLFKFKLKENICEKCGLGEIWNGEKIVHQLDHINGNNLDNRLENIKLLCPNCHSQTDTFTGKKNKKNDFRCLDCNEKLERIYKTGYCKKCYVKHR